MDRRVVVTGLGCVTPIGNNVPDFWASLLAGHSGAAEITKFDTTNFKTKFACEVKNFNPKEFMEHKELKKLDPSTIFAMVATEEAMKDSRLDITKVNSERCGVIFASGIGGLNTLEEQLDDYNNNGRVPRFSPFFITKMILNMSAGQIAIKYNFQGINFSPVSACASANHAIICAYNFIKTGQADVIISGGSEAAITQSAMGGFNAMKALSTKNDSPQTASKPYDAERDGFVLGEGAGALIIEDYEHAVKRGATIYAEIMGGGMSSDAYHVSAPHPEGTGAALCMKNALKNSNLNYTDINYINTHGTSTPAGDIPELKAIAKVFTDNLPNMYITSTKSMTGHLLGAASAVEAIATILSIKNDIIPATINTKNLDPELPANINIVLGDAKATKVHYGLSNSFGFGGHNASVIFGK